MNAHYLFDSAVMHHFDTADLARWTGGTWRGPAPQSIHGFSIDTRTLRAGDVFIAIKGDAADGHAYLTQAMARGAAAVMIEHEEAMHGLDFARLVVPNTREALLALARGYRRTLHGRVAAVTGSVGKTTVKELLADMLQPVGITARTRGNWNNDLGMPLSLLAAPPGAQFGVFELGMNHAGELDPLCEILAPDLSIVTCVGPVHIEYFENEAGIAHEKAAVYRGLKGQGIAVLNADDAYAGLLREAADGNRIIEVSFRGEADVICRRSGRPGTFQIIERATGDVEEFSAPLPGDYFVLDATLAAAAARALGVSWPVIRHAIQHYQPLAMRWNRHSWFGVHTVNDAYNANPVSLRAALQAFMEEPCHERRWVVLAGMLELGSDEERIHREAGAFIAQQRDIRLVTVGPRGAWLAEGAAAAGMPAGMIHACPDHEAAARVLCGVLRVGDAVLFKASRGEAADRVLTRWKALREEAG